MVQALSELPPSWGARWIHQVWFLWKKKPKSMVDGVGRARGTFVARVAKVDDSIMTYARVFRARGPLVARVASQAR